MNWWQSRRWLSNSIGLNGFSLALFPFRFVSLQHECFSFRFVLFNLLWNFPLCDDYLKFYFKWSVAESWNWKWGQKKPKWSRCDFHFFKIAANITQHTSMYISDSGDDGNHRRWRNDNDMVIFNFSHFDQEIERTRYFCTTDGTQRVCCVEVKES